HWLAITPVVSGAGFGVPLSYDTLTAFYRTKKLAVHPEAANVCAVLDINDLKTIDLSSVAEIEVGDDVRDVVVWEVLGRMCHLLGDMSVPAHAHLDEHGLNPDSYEDYVGGPGDPYKAWSASNVGPAVIRNEPGRQVLHFLMYLMQQRADHFGSNGPANGNGNDNIGGDATSLERGLLTGADLSWYGGPTTDAGPWSETNLKTIRDKTLPFAIRATAGLLYWFAHEAGLMPRLTTTGAPGRIERVPSAARLWQNYPNPFNPSTTIRYSLPRRSAVQLTIYTMLGQMVTRLVDDTQGEGEHEVRFDAAGLASGVYVYALKVGATVQTKSFCLLR
ncbi:MAG TPA: T9SS type A sorting domain-containing protein, partial [Bacteroidota bacterium]